MEGDREQPSLAAGGDQRPDIEERRVAQPAAFEDADQPALLDDVEPSRLALDADDVERRVQPTDDRARPERGALDLLRRLGARRERALVGRGPGRARDPERAQQREYRRRPHDEHDSQRGVVSAP